jgi:hypothetical protein
MKKRVGRAILGGALAICGSSASAVFAQGAGSGAPAPPASDPCGAMGPIGMFMACPNPAQGSGTMVGFEVRLAAELDAAAIDQLRITVTVLDQPTSYSPWLVPEQASANLLAMGPYATPHVQTCLDSYSLATAVVEGLASGRTVARGAVMFETADCAQVTEPVTLEAPPSSGSDTPEGGDRPALIAPSSDAGTPPDTGGTGATGTGGGGSSGNADAGTSAGDSSGCTCTAIGAGAGFEGLVLAAGLVLARVVSVRRRGTRSTALRRP